MHSDNGYGLWWLVAANSGIFIVFVFSFWRPRSGTDWRAFGGFVAFVIALFTEMYGFPLTIYLLSGWIQHRFPNTDILTHDFGHLWSSLIGWKGNPHLSPFHILSDILILVGMLLLASSWRVLHESQRSGQLAATGPYAYVRHPQYLALIAIMFGFLLQWPTIVTLIMFPILVVMYVRLARREEREVAARLGAEYERYAAVTPAFLPKIRTKPPTESLSGGRGTVRRLTSHSRPS